MQQRSMKRENRMHMAGGETDAGLSSRSPSGGWRPSLSNGSALLMLAPLGLLLLLFVLYPLFRLGAVSLSAGDGLGNYSAVLGSPAGRRALIVTLVGALLVTAIAVPVGTILTWYVLTAKRKFVRSVLLLCVFLPLWMGTVVKNYAIILLVARNGAINRLLALVDIGPLELLYTPTGVIIGMVYTMIPYAVFSLYGTFSTIDRDPVAAARSLGASRFRAIRTAFLPLALPGMVASAAIVFAIALGFYVTPVVLGGAQSPFMASLIQYYIFSYFDYPFASAASVLLLLLALIVLGVSLRIVGSERLLRSIR